MEVEMEVEVEEEVFREKPEEPTALSNTCKMNCCVSWEDSGWSVILMEIR